MIRCLLFAGLLISVLSLASCQRSTPSPQAGELSTVGSTQPPSLVLVAGTSPKDFPGVHNAIRVSERFIGGGVPEGDAGFDSLMRLGIRTVISVDGARPDVERARQFKLRYVHLPIGYDGVSREQALRIARAVRDLPGQVYIH